MIVEKIVIGEFYENCYIVGCEKTKKAVIIDPGGEGSKIKSFIKEKRLIPRFIINTHGHIDHIRANDQFNLPVYIHEFDREYLTDPVKNLSSFFPPQYVFKGEVITIKEGEKIEVGSLSFEIIHTPGHTPGSICLKTENIVFTGDTLFAGGVGRTDFPGGDENILFSSIREKLFTLPEEIIIYPGHGPSSTIGDEKREMEG